MKIVRPLLASFLVVAALPAHAALVLRYSDIGTSGVDAAFEGPGGYLNSVRGLPLVGGSALAPLERSVGQLRQAATDRRGHYLPTSSGTGLPVADGGTGVTTALTNVSPFASSTADFGNGVALGFSVKRVGNIVTFTFGDNVLASNGRASLLDINAIEFRIRTQALTDSIGANSIVFSDLKFSDSLVTDQMLPGFSAANGQVLIQLWEGIAPGDFTLSGNITQSWTPGQRPGGSALATQLKLLDIPPIPEAQTWAMLIAGFGMIGSAMRRRRTPIAAA